MLNCSTMVVIKSIWLVALALAVMMMIGSTFHPRIVMLFSSGWNLFVLFIMVWLENISLE